MWISHPSRDLSNATYLASRRRLDPGRATNGPGECAQLPPPPGIEGNDRKDGYLMGIYMGIYGYLWLFGGFLKWGVPPNG